MTYILLLILLFALELLYFFIADRFNIIDKPNQRSSHTSITLRGGGVIFYISILLYFFLEGFQYPWFFAGLTMISFISFADDIKPRSSKIRLAVHFVSMALMFYQWNLFELPWYYTVISLIFCTGILNAYNFMDGINGITGGYSLAVIGGLWYINSYQIYFIDTNFLLYLTLSLLVFDFFNFKKKAKCFAGDVGAVSMAFIIVFLLGLLIIKTHDFSYIILLAMYGVDSILTIIHRIILKENIFEPHRKHVYQIMANELKIPHVLVSMFYALAQVLIVVGFLYFKTYLYPIIVVFILSLLYVIFKKKYFHLHIIK
jgi:UDP-N-acetylmuramyl pentapeptide phosphotransferase/UDP-N-acetylglucosamine-1-phosphate transferase